MSTEKPGNPPPPKIYIGNAKVKVRRSGDQFLVGFVCIDDLNKIPDEYIKTSDKNRKKYVKIIINPFKDGPNQHENTHSISVDTYRQDPNEKINEE